MSEPRSESSGVTLRLTERKIPSLLRSVCVRFWASTVKSCPGRSVRARDRTRGRIFSGRRAMTVASGRRSVSAGPGLMLVRRTVTSPTR